MNCDEIEIRLLEFLDNQLPAAERTVVETHLAYCDRCQALSRQLAEMDAALMRSVKVPALTPDFNVRLRQRVALSEAERQDRIQQLQAEFETRMARLRQESLGLAGAWTILRNAVLAASGGWLILELAPAAQPWALSGLVVVAGLALAFSEKLKRLWI